MSVGLIFWIMLQERPNRARFWNVNLQMWLWIWQSCLWDTLKSIGSSKIHGEPIGVLTVTHTFLGTPSRTAAWGTKSIQLVLRLPHVKCKDVNFALKSTHVSSAHKENSSTMNRSLGSSPVNSVNKLTAGYVLTTTVTVNTVSTGTLSMRRQENVKNHRSRAVIIWSKDTVYSAIRDSCWVQTCSSVRPTVPWRTAGCAHKDRVHNVRRGTHLLLSMEAKCARKTLVASQTATFATVTGHVYNASSLWSWTEPTPVSTTVPSLTVSAVKPKTGCVTNVSKARVSITGLRFASHSCLATVGFIYLDSVTNVKTGTSLMRKGQHAYKFVIQRIVQLATRLIRLCAWPARMDTSW